MKHGYFDDKKREFVITNMKPARFWYNYLWNEELVCVCDQFGSGNSWGMLGEERRTIESGERNVYVKDLTTGKYYSANRNHADLPFDTFEGHVGLGYHTVVSIYDGVKTEFTTLTPTNDVVTLFKIKITNISTYKKELGVYFNICPQPNLTPHSAYGYAKYDEEQNGLIYSHNGFNVKSPYKQIFVGSEKSFDAYDICGRTFKGIYNTYRNPIGLEQDSLASKDSSFEGEYVAAFQFNVSLAGGESFENTFCATWISAREECTRLRETYLGNVRFETIKEQQQQLNENYLDTFELQSPDDYLNSQTNIWLKRQVSLGKTWGRLYGKGFRDVMQDITAFVSFDTELARKRILYALRYQYEDGNPIRMFEPNFRYPYNDGGVWITGAVLSYLNESGDLSVLEEELPYLQ